MSPEGVKGGVTDFLYELALERNSRMDKRAQSKRQDQKDPKEEEAKPLPKINRPDNK